MTSRFTFFTFILFVVFSQKTFAQKYQHIEEIVKKYPTSIKKPERLAHLIVQDFSSEEDKAVAAYIWIAQNIKYDVKEFKKITSGKKKPPSFTAKNSAELEKKVQKYYNEKMLSALKKKKGVCDHYSLIYKAVAENAGLQIERVTGYSKNDFRDLGKMPKKPDHAWNKVKVNNEWRYIDATWGAGFVDMKTNKFVKRLNYNYCLTPETKFSLNHIDEKLPKPEVSKQRTLFSKSPFYHSYYIGSDIEMISPSTAKVSAKGEKTIEIKIKDFPENQALVYHFQTAKKRGHILPISREDSISTFQLPCDFKLKDLAHLYIGSEPLVSFNVSSR